MDVRRSESEDGRYFNNLVTNLGGPNLFRALFGQYNFTSLVEYSYCSLIGLNESDQCGLFATFNDGMLTTQDNVPFHELLDALTEVLPCRLTNSLLLNFWAFDNSVATEQSAHELLRSVFARDPALDYVFFVCSSTVVPPDFLSSFFCKVNISKRENVSPKDPYKKSDVYVLERAKILPRLLVREARVEDNDDLLPILQASNPGIANGQEEYFLADLIQSQDESSKFFVGVHKNRPVGMLATTLDINAELLTRVFDLDSYSGLIIKPDDEYTRKQFVVMLLGDQSVLKNVNISGLCKSNGAALIDLSKSYDPTNPNNKEIVLNHMVASVQRIADSSKKYRGCFITGFPNNEEECRALLDLLETTDFSLNAIIELQHYTDDVDVDVEEDLLGEYLDSVEMLKNQILNTNVYTTEWKRIAVGDNTDHGVEDVEDLILVELKTLCDTNEKIVEEEERLNMAGLTTNSFAISLFSMDEHYESRSEDLITVAFEEYPTLDYCVLLLPNSSLPSAALTYGMQCPRVREGVSFDQSLYVIHRQSLLANDYLTVERLHQDSLDKTEALLSVMEEQDKETVLSFASHSLRDSDVDLMNNPGEVSFTIKVEDEVVGLICMSRKLTTSEDVMHFRNHYMLDDHIIFERHRGRSQAMIVHWVMNPIYSQWSRFVLREVMRVYHKTVLYYHHLTRETKPGIEIMEEMFPVSTRFGPQAKKADAENMNGEGGYQQFYPLFFMQKKKLIDKKAKVGKRVVIVGGNSSAFSILEKIALCHDIHVANIFLIMEHPPQVWLSKQELGANESGDNFSGCLSLKDLNDMTEQELNALGLPARCTLVQGRLTDIDRKNRAVIVSDEVIVEYDVLVVASGMQDMSIRKFPATAQLHPTVCAERGVFCMGNYAIDKMALNFIEQQLVSCRNKNKSDVIVVAGNGTQALCVLGRLEVYGVDPSRIVWVRTRDTATSEVEHDEINALIEMGIEGDEDDGMPHITVYNSHEILDVQFGSPLGAESEEEQIIEGLNIRHYPTAGSVMGHKDDVLPCCAFICCSNEQCDVDVFAAINDTGLVYDGGVVVDENFRTVDPNIYAAGPMTKYSRRYKDQVPHKRCNPRELGTYVANEIIAKHLTVSSRNDLNSVTGFGFHDAMAKAPSVEQIQFKTFHMPVIHSGIFPGNIDYVMSSLPERKKCAQIDRYLLSGPRDDRTQRACGVTLDALGVCCEIVCAQRLFDNSSQQDKDIAINVGPLVGWHESYLNSAMYAFECAQVVDWIEFLTGSWSETLRCDKFPALCEIIRKSLHSDKGMIAILDKVMEAAEAADDNLVVTNARRSIMGDRGSSIDAGTKNVVVSHTIDFLRKNKSLFPNFLIPMPSKGKGKRDHK
mmetsp:Transcript_25436/g.42865  ORF Transcript_25436/g.42865 Transcript_25436/m.42865 type:complete len:1363 (+) Transcript_25436:41-4129(+)|eukprot:CAMPEP_0114466720 /NCGR_PEP_ID=MMETSP0104-20121206/9228_1 /TAXON_ID=37642 ORGANISM="Paraphysomonas imperforata, Strain PA2" /NCGR_SAMPLE_ID=MMETSP0104 /ASSEMBLY_ACC=CAM_ASM_000202 /LENGTH=1362 /DNA_ID=CAMNT_0001640115 /DNA_START=27 /DNA_END=4115 /DNA_ORIENTATION=-